MPGEMSKQTAPKTRETESKSESQKSPRIFSDRRAKREHFQALGHRRGGRQILPVEGAPWNVCQTRYREFQKFEKHLELDTALFFLPEV